jgi:hypothetical protein
MDENLNLTNKHCLLVNIKCNQQNKYGMGSSNQVTQNGNTSLVWVRRGGGLSNHDVIVPQVDNASNSGVRISDVTFFQVPEFTYSVRITVEGSDAVAFRVNNGAIG